MGIFHFKKHLNSPRTFFKDLGEPEGFPHGLKVPRPRLKHGSCDELSRIFLFLFHIPTRLREKLPPQFHCVSFHDFTISRFKDVTISRFQDCNISENCGILKYWNLELTRKYPRKFRTINTNKLFITFDQQITFSPRRLSWGEAREWSKLIKIFGNYNFLRIMLKWQGNTIGISEP